MKISILTIGKTDEKYLVEGISKYLARLSHYTKIEYLEIKDVKSGSTIEETLKRESELIHSKLKSDDVLILLDEFGTQYSSVELASFIEKLQNNSTKSCVLLIGGAYGHHESIHQRAQYKLSLSKCTFTHQMVRLVLTEQLYRAFTIIRKEKYHNV